MKKTLQALFPLVIFCLISTPTFSQKKGEYYNTGFKIIDSLAIAGKPKDAVFIVNELNARARLEQNTTVLIKSVMYRMLFQGHLEEDAFSKINVELKQDIAKAQQPAKSILYSLLAESYWKYYEQNRYNLMNRTNVQSNLGDDIKTWPVGKFIDEIIKNYLASVANVKILQNTKIDSLSKMMIGDSQNRFLRPMLYDILAHRALDVFLNTQIELTKKDDSIDFDNVRWFDDYQSFLTTEIPGTDSTSFAAKALRVFQILIKTHQDNQNISALADADLRRLNYIYSRNTRTDKLMLYSAAIQKLADYSKSTEIYADVLFELASKKYEARYNQDPKQRPDLKELLELANIAIKAYPESIGAKNFEKLITDIKNKTLSITMNQFLAPGKPSQLLFKYKNTKAISVKLFKIGQKYDRFYFNSQPAYDKFLSANKIYREWTVNLPESDDYQEHTLIDKLDALEKGRYVIIANTAGNNATFNYTIFQVTNLAVTNRISGIVNHQYFVANSSNGNAIPNAIVKEKMHEYENGKYVYKDRGTLRTDKEGFAESTLNASVNRIEIIYGNDSVAMDINQRAYKYMSMTPKVVLFTDRPIYRPGQTVFYKGIYFEFEDEKNRILKEESVDVTFNDVNRKEIEKTSKITNEFGTFQGSFTIPMGKLNGRMSINTAYGSVDVQVEEYKRLTFEVLFNQLNQKYKLNDSILLQGKAISFAGYAVAGAKVKYVITRNILSAHNQIYGYNSSRQIANGTTETKAGGIFNIRFMAAAENNNINGYSYQINVDITDSNGETRTKSQVINAGKSDVLLNVSMPTDIFPAHLKDSIAFEITNLNRSPIKGKVSAEWYKLEYPGRIVYPAALGKPEKYNLTRDEFVKQFPFEDYQNDGNPEHWIANKLSLSQVSNVEQGLGNLEINSKELTSGYYKVIFKAINDDLDSVVVERIIRVYQNSNEKILLAKEWLLPEKTIITHNESAVFRFASVLPNARGYYEVYYKDRIVNKVWLQLTNKQTSVNIKPEPEFVDGFAVQFTLVQNGKIYQSMNVINIVDENKDLEIKFLSFREKLQPGEKDVWKVKIANKKGEKQMAEMVVSLYDASLDDLKTMSWNKITSPKYNYNVYDWGYNLNIIQTGNEIWPLKIYQAYYDIIKRKYESINYYGFNFNPYNLKYNYSQYLAQIETNKRKQVSEAATKKLALLKETGLVYGIVTDQDGYGIPGVSVRTDKKTVATDGFGIYSIDAKAGDEIKVSFIGYDYATATVGTAKRINFKLKENGKGLHEVAVVGYGTQMKHDVTGSVSTLREEVIASPVGEGPVRSIRIRGSNSIAYNQNGDPTPDIEKAIAVEDNKVYDFMSVEMYDPQTDTYIINGKPVKKAKVVPRTNFTETAFFYPQLKTDEAGEINIEFTIPQSLTRYKMMGFAHTKDFKTSTITKELITQKQLSISANAPRFFREGDTILFSAKLNNLSGKAIDGIAILELKDAISGKVIPILDKNESLQQNFQLVNNGNQSLKWTLIIPSGIGAITYKLIAQSENYSDGEEMTIPVLPNSMLVTESMPMNVRGGMSKTFTMDRLLDSGNSKTLRNQSVTFEFTSNPVWYAVQALPYLMEYPFECVEQTFSRFYANSFAVGIINSSPKIKTVFESWQQTNNGETLGANLDKNPSLKSILLEETPWVRNAGNETERKKRLAILFDLNRMTYELQANFDKLENMQFNNGSFPWFSGMKEDRYITQHIALGIGQLKHLKLVDEKSFPKLNQMLAKSINYLDGKLTEDYHRYTKERTLSTYLPIHYLLARSYTSQKNSNPEFLKAYQFFLKKIISDWKYMEPYQLAQSALILERNSNHAEAMKIINLLKQTARQNDETGMYWMKNQSGWWWYQSPVETQALLIEAFDEVAKDAKSVEEMKIWLLKNKQTNDWKTTKATAAASYALLMRGYNLLSESAEPEVLIDGKSFSELGIIKPVKEEGTGYEKITIPGQKVKPEMAKVQIKNNNKGIAWGTCYWQYFEQLDKITSAATGVKINKQLFLQKQTEKGNLLTPLTSSNILLPGDLLKVRIEIFCDRDMEYIHLKDMRSSGFEPVNVISQYKYQDGLGYYESTKEASTNFFINHLYKGTYVFEYPLRVTHAGNFSNGVTTLQSMYAPEFTTHSGGIRVNVKP
ncbi:alpha-2-macroglobulin family protein [Pedobacter chinensis]|nr:MG2 domain-containing protein [Pedobacter chinensis]